MYENRLSFGQATTSTRFWDTVYKTFLPNLDFGKISRQTVIANMSLTVLKQISKLPRWRTLSFALSSTRYYVPCKQGAFMSTINKSYNWLTLSDSTQRSPTQPGA